MSHLYDEIKIKIKGDESMLIKIGKVCFGIKTNKIIKRNLIPHDTVNKNHCYFEYFYWWLWFYWCKPRKCEVCGEYICSYGGDVEWNEDGNKVEIIMCRKCSITHAKDEWRRENRKKSCAECGKCGL